MIYAIKIGIILRNGSKLKEYFSNKITPEVGNLLMFGVGNFVRNKIFFLAACN